MCVCMGERKRFFLIEINLFLHICRNCAVELCTRKSLLILNLAIYAFEGVFTTAKTHTCMATSYGLDEHGS